MTGRFLAFALLTRPAERHPSAGSRGFDAWMRHDKMLAFSCRRPGSWLRRPQDIKTEAHLVDHVILHVPVMPDSRTIARPSRMHLRDHFMCPRCNA